MAEDTPASRGLASRLLAHEGGDGGDQGRGVDAADRVCQKLHGQLAPIIGEGGFRAVALRALKLTRVEFPFLTFDPGLEQSACTRGLGESVQGQEPALIAAALTALVANSVDVLAGLLGRDLTFRFLQKAWPEIPLD